MSSSRIFTVSEAAVELFGASTPATRARVRLLTDRGELACIRLGNRGDRAVPQAALDEFIASAFIATGDGD